MEQQLVLGLALQDIFTLESYYEPPAHAVVVSALKKMLLPQGEPYSVLQGGQGTGKTHLLKGVVAYAHYQNKRAIYLDLAQCSVLQLAGLENYALVVLDNLDSCAGKEDFEQALLFLIHKILPHHSQCIVSTSVPLQSCPWGLKELGIRLGWGVTLPLKALAVSDYPQALAYRTQHQGGNLSADLAQVLAKRSAQAHLPFSTIPGILQAIHQDALHKGKRLTASLIRDWFAQNISQE